jgi:hypothetical protein
MQSPASLNPRLEGLPAKLVTAIAEGSVFNGHGEKTPLHSNISQSEAETLYNLVREVKPTYSVQGAGVLGTFSCRIQHVNRLNSRHFVPGRLLLA